MKKSTAIDKIIYVIVIALLLKDFAISMLKGQSALVSALFMLIEVIALYFYRKDCRSFSVNKFILLYILVFEGIAPMKQFDASSNLWGLTDYDVTSYLKSEFIVLLFLCTYLLSSNYLAKKVRLIRFHLSHQNTRREYHIKRKTLVVFALIDILIILFLQRKGLLISRNGQTNVWGGSTFQLFFRIIIFTLPVTNQVAVYLKADNGNLICDKKSFLIYKLFSWMCIIIIYFPLWGNMPRYLLFSVYIILVIILVKKLKHQSLLLLAVVAGFYYIFPAFNFFKFHNLSEISNFALGNGNFIHFDYDAHQVLMTTMSYVEDQGVLWGKNIISAILCFIPRSIWQGKTLPSGQMIAEFYNAGFSNISCPLYAEFYLALGIAGVIIFSLLFGCFVKYLETGYQKKYSNIKGVCIIVTGMIIYIMRGALLPAASYTLGIVVAYGISNIIGKCLSKL